MIKQLSVFVENRTGSLYRVTNELTEGGINIRAIASFDTPDFAILRLVVDNTEEAKVYLTSKGFVVRIHEVMGVELEDKQGSLNNMLGILADNEISLNYIYSFIIRNGKAPVMVFATDDYDRAAAVLEKAGVKMVEEEEL
ncbi:ACT domain-containing protein [Bariatricus massiliensis]|mgnify:CR=1 FL=1|uniref:ACT domain-containing protein n=1 Tax=Bariatricus massiliensis TaxID=1745713 RepID=A0ABS8DKE5_9FIRM|nr:ACT domain-containing protein [Bariatricus massiliensis]MCB7305374.1 ACT domain-containing protein [Bariatricus massiliensis]MCB7375928.1 ACT domain-containing protein [Bariatricus massiliensis]MCB7388517.1 ACT domain-containing protein [Bariatricus massiliensis]MCB7412690.1 ACT domain-containing protein [Bariatricus massiliensis]MCQ5252108.1 ACT domain-containing protein [Bariatricus massiliensis]